MAVTLTSSYQYITRAGAKTQNGSGTHYILLYAKTSPNNTTGYHTVTIKAVLASNYGSFYDYDTVTTGKINGSTAFTKHDLPTTAWSGKNAIAAADAGGTKYAQSTELGVGSISVDCTNCQSKTITISAAYNFKSTGDTFTPVKGSTTTASASVVLPAILRQATVTNGPNFDDEESPTITYSNPAGINATLTACISYYSEEEKKWVPTAVPYRSIPNNATSYTFNLTDDERNALRAVAKNTNTLDVRYYITTVVGGTSLETSSSASLNIIDANPTATISLTEGNEKIRSLLGSDAGTTIVKGVSDLEALVIPTLKKEATLKSIVIKNGNTTTTTPTSQTETFNGAIGELVTYTVTDSRDNTCTGTVNLTVIDYQPLEITASEFKRTSLDSNEVALNARIKCFIGNIKDSENTFTISYEGSNGKTGSITAYGQEGSGTNGVIVIDNLSLGEELVGDSEVATFTLKVQDICSEDGEYATASNKIILIIPTFEAGAHDFRINGDLIIADEKGSNPKNIMEMLYPVGSIYITMDKNFLPGKTFGGTWVQFGAGKTLVGVDSADEDFDTVRKTGGHKTIASHTHSLTIDSKTLTGSWKQNRSRFGGTNTVAGIVSNIKEEISGYFNETGGTDTNTVGISINATHSHSGSVGSTGTGNQGNLQPYITVYMWERTE